MESQKVSLPLNRRYKIIAIAPLIRGSLLKYLSSNQALSFSPRLLLRLFCKAQNSNPHLRIAKKLNPNQITS